MSKQYRFIPSIHADEIIPTQVQGIQNTLNHVLKNSPQYQEKLQGFCAGDIKHIDDIKKLPFTTTDDLKNAYPLPLLSVPQKDIVRIHASSGTTGKRKILAYTANDIANFNLQMARCYEMAGLTTEDRMQIAVGYGLWTAGAGFQLGSELFGALTIPVGPGNLDMHLQLLQDLQSTCIGCTSSMALLMAEEVERNGLLDKITLRRAIFGSETSSEKMRRSIMSKLGLEDCFNIGGMTETYGPGASIDCEAHEGLHYWSDLFYYEIINPETLENVADGEIGELVITSLKKEASPLIRYRTRDLTRLIPGTCSCGCAFPRHDNFLGRSDDMIIVKGVNIYPGQITDIIHIYPELGGEYHIELTRENAKDSMTLKLEAESNFNFLASTAIEDISKSFASAMQKKLMVSGKVEIVPYGSLPRSFGKSKRVTDLRYI